jgi:hypothetical protein
MPPFVWLAGDDDIEAPLPFTISRTDNGDGCHADRSGNVLGITKERLLACGTTKRSCSLVLSELHTKTESLEACLSE